MMFNVYKKDLKKGETCLHKPGAVGQKKAWKIENTEVHALEMHIF